MNNEWLKEMITVGMYLLPEAMRNNADELTIKVEPEYQWVKVEASNKEETVTATHWAMIKRTDITRHVNSNKNAPQEMASFHRGTGISISKESIT